MIALLGLPKVRCTLDDCAVVGRKYPIKAIDSATATQGSRNLKSLVFFMFLVFKYTISVYGLRPKYQVFRDTKSIKAVNCWADSRAIKSADFKDHPQGAGHVASTSVLST
ncbi:hypothetical protein [Nostoc sp.]|uniref:hypothetical protein n=1 Tax=Nostoc sp. TaxID=1180 RepID=UPI002FF48843